MTDKINELKALIENMDDDSPLRKSLEEALAAEARRKADEQEARQAEQEAETQSGEEDEEDTDTDTGESSSSDILGGFAGKLDELLEDDEFIAASAGFLLGAVTVGAGALAISVLKK